MQHKTDIWGTLSLFSALKTDELLQKRIRKSIARLDRRLIELLAREQLQLEPNKDLEYYHKIATPTGYLFPDHPAQDLYMFYLMTDD